MLSTSIQWLRTHTLAPSHPRRNKVHRQVNNIRYEEFPFLCQLRSPPVPTTWWHEGFIHAWPAAVRPCRNAHPGQQLFLLYAGDGVLSVDGIRLWYFITRCNRGGVSIFPCCSLDFPWDSLTAPLLCRCRLNSSEVYLLPEASRNDGLFSLIFYDIFNFTSCRSYEMVNEPMGLRWCIFYSEKRCLRSRIMISFSHHPDQSGAHPSEDCLLGVIRESRREPTKTTWWLVRWLNAKEPWKDVRALPLSLSISKIPWDSLVFCHSWRIRGLVPCCCLDGCLCPGWMSLFQVSGYEFWSQVAVRMHISEVCIFELPDVDEKILLYCLIK